MLTETMRDYYAYADWANARIFEQAAKLSDEQYFNSDLQHIWPVHRTLVHMMSGQEVWLRRWQGRQTSGLANPEDYADLDAILAKWVGVGASTNLFLSELTDERLGADFQFRNYKGDPFTAPLWKSMLHQCNHQTYHRGEVAALLSRFGCSPGEIDYSRYFYAGN